MNFKTTYLLFGFLGVIVVVLLLVLFYKPTPELARGGFLLPSANNKDKKLEQTEVTRLEVARTQPSEQKFVFERNADDRWVMTEPANVRIDSGTVEGLVGQLLRARSADQDVRIDMKAAGLDTPHQVFTLKTKDDRTWTISLGETTPGEQSALVYASSSEFPGKPIPVLKNELDSAFYELNQFRSRDLLHEVNTQVVYVRVQQKGKDPVILENPAENLWNFVKPPYGEADYDGKAPPPFPMPGVPPTPAAPGVRGLVSALTGIRVGVQETGFGGKKDAAESGFVNGSATDPRFGLKDEADAEWVLEVRRLPLGDKDRKEATKAVLFVGKKADEKGDFYYARLFGEENKNNIVKVQGTALEPIIKFYEKPEEVRDRNLVKLAKAPAVIRLENAGGTLDFIPEATEFAEIWKLWLGDKAYTADVMAVKVLISMLIQENNVRDWPTGKKDEELGLDKPTAHVWIWTDPPEKQSDEDKKAGKKPKIRDPKDAILLEFGKHDAEKKTVVVRRTRGGNSTVVAVADAILASKDQPLVTGTLLTYLDKFLKPFDNPEQVTRILVEKEGKAIDLTRADPMTLAKGWMLSDPQGPEGKKVRKADEFACRKLLFSLASMQAERWHTLKANEAELKEMGLDPGVVRVSVYLKDKEKEPLVIRLGNDADGKKPEERKPEDRRLYYGKLSKDDMVFVMDDLVLKATEGDFRDLAVLDFKTDNVVSVKFKGWQDIIAEEAVRELERKGPQNWEVKNAPKLAANSNNVETVLRQLERLRAEKFVPKAGPMDDQGFDFKKGMLEIEIMLKDAKEPLRLVVGKVTKEKVGGVEKEFYFATSKVSDGEVFLVPKGPFEELKKGPAYLASPKDK